MMHGYNLGKKNMFHEEFLNLKRYMTKCCMICLQMIGMILKTTMNFKSILIRNLISKMAAKKWKENV